MNYAHLFGNRLFLTVFVIACIAPRVMSQVLHERNIVTSDGQSSMFDAFALCVAADDTYLVVGAQSDSTNGLGAGAVYVFDINTGEQLHKLIASTVSAHDIFGSSVDIDDGMIVVGSRMDNVRGKNSGSAYVFDAESGEELHKFKMNDGKEHHQFGYAVAIDDGLIAISAPGDRDGRITDDPKSLQASGSVYIFDVSTFELKGKIRADNPVEHNWFGKLLALEGNLLAIASPMLVQVYDAHSLEMLSEIRDVSDTKDRFYAHSISIAGGEVLVNGTDRVKSSFHTGVVHVHDALTGEWKSTLKPDDAASDNYFGGSIAALGDYAVIGATGDSTLATRSGAAYLFHIPERREITKLLPAAGAEYSGFATVSIAMSDDLIAVSQPGQDVTIPGGGSVYIFDLPQVDSE